MSVELRDHPKVLKPGALLKNAAMQCGFLWAIWYFGEWAAFANGVIVGLLLGVVIGLGLQYTK